MQLNILFLALMSMLVSALPTLDTPSGRGATIYKEPNFAGASTAIPGINFCTNLNNIFGGFDLKVRSLTVEPGYSCQFFLDVGCPSNGKKLDLHGGDKMGELGGDYDSKIRGAICAMV